MRPTPARPPAAGEGEDADIFRAPRPSNLLEQVKEVTMPLTRDEDIQALARETRPSP